MPGRSQGHLTFEHFFFGRFACEIKWSIEQHISLASCCKTWIFPGWRAKVDGARCSTRFGLTQNNALYFIKSDVVKLLFCCFVVVVFLNEIIQKNNLLTLEVQLIHQTTPTCWGWSILDQWFFAIPWKFLATIFYGLVSEPPCFKCKGLTLSKRNYHFLERCLTS